MHNEQIRDTIDTRLSGVTFTAKNKQAVLATIKGEPKIMKRKIPAALIFALMIVLLAGVTFAIVQWHQHAEEIAKLEAEQGYYDEWPADSRVALVRHLVEGGVLAPNDDTDRLFGGGLTPEEASRLATEIVAEWGSMREDNISLMSILETVWGVYPDAWSTEDLAWYTETLQDIGTLPKDHERFYVPDGTVLTQEEAIAIAKEIVRPIVNYPQEIWDSYTISATYRTLDHPENDKPYWYVHFMPSTRWTTRTYIPAVALDPITGEVYSDAYTLSPQAAWDEYWSFLHDDSIIRLRHLSHAERAEPSEGYYGVPDTQTLPEEEALRIARAVFAEQRGYTDEQLAALTPYAFYIPDNGGGRPAWSIRYYDESFPYPDSYTVLSVEMYADTGEVYITLPWE